MNSVSIDKPSGYRGGKPIAWCDLNRVDAASYIAFHLVCLSALVVPPRASDLVAGATLFMVSSFGLSVGWHRHLCHRSFETSRWFRFILVFCGSMSGLKGGLWFAQYHGHHHRLSDRAADIHSPLSQGFLYSYCIWFLCDRYRETELGLVPGWAGYRELVWLDRYTFLISAGTGAAIFALLGTGGLIWGYFVATALFWHTAQSIGTVCHHGIGGYRRYTTPDNSFNNPLVSLLACGEGWHNNHHKFPYAAQLGHAWWEVDPGWWCIRLFERLGLVWHVRRPRPGKADCHAHRFRTSLEALRHAVSTTLSDRRVGTTCRNRIDTHLRYFEHAALDRFKRRPSLLPKTLHDLFQALEALPDPAPRLKTLIREHLAAGPAAHLWFRPIGETRRLPKGGRR